MTWARWIGIWLVAALALNAPAHARGKPQLLDVSFGGHDGGMRIVVDFDSRPHHYNVFTLTQGGYRVVVDFEPQVAWRGPHDGCAGGQTIGAGDGFVARYRFAQNSAHRSRLVFDTVRPVRVVQQAFLRPDTHQRTHQLVLDLAPDGRPGSYEPHHHHPHGHGGLTGCTVAEIIEPIIEVPPASIEEPPAPPQREWVVVLDPGHGGHDPGALGVRTEVEEKEINLEVAKEIREELARRGGYQVVLTREDDRFLTLHERVTIAREAGADLFISIHADSNRDRRARGASVYTLAERSASRSRTEILSEQNWLIDTELEGRPEAVNEILVDLAQRATQNRSADFADILVPRLKTVGPVLRNTHRSAGYYVLLAPDVPAVLLETGFLSDASDEKRLRSSRHRGRIARAVAEAIDDFFDGPSRRA